MTSRILVAGDGVGARTVYQGLLAVGVDPGLHSNDSEILKVALDQGSEVFLTLKQFIEAFPSGMIILSGYKPIVTAEIHAQVRTLNVHPSLLPKYRGMHSVVWALLNGEEEVGITLHEVDDLVDHGDILWQSSVRSEGKNAWELMIDLYLSLEESIGNVVLAYDKGFLIPTVQDHKQATFCGRRRPEDCRIDWGWTCEFFKRIFQVLVPPYPRPYFEFKNKNWEVVRADVIERDYLEIPGHVLYRDHESVWIKIKDGVLRVYEISHQGETFAATEIINKVYHRL